MKTAILCLIFLIVGAVGGAVLTGYLVDRHHKRTYAFLFASDLVLVAMHAEQLKQGEPRVVLNNLENSIPTLVTALHENDMFSETTAADTAMMAAKRFYVCTGTQIPTEVGELLERVSLPEDTCGPRP